MWLPAGPVPATPAVGVSGVVGARGGYHEGRSGHVQEVCRLLEISPSASAVIRHMVDSVVTIGGIWVALGRSDSTNGAGQAQFTLTRRSRP
jgi:hypothetical protein